jgi:hypothetical protein
MDKILPWLKSKTVWFAMLLQLAPVVQAYYGAVNDPFGYMVIGMFIIGLRAITTKPLSEK